MTNYTVIAFKAGVDWMLSSPMHYGPKKIQADSPRKAAENYIQSLNPVDETTCWIVKVWTGNEGENDEPETFKITKTASKMH